MSDLGSRGELILHVITRQEARGGTRRKRELDAQRCSSSESRQGSLRHCLGRSVQRVILPASIMMLVIQTAVCQRHTFQRVQTQQPNRQAPHQNAELRAPTSDRLEAPKSVYQTPNQGPGIDLVALNLRRFEMNHAHPYRYEPNNPHVVLREEFDEDADLLRGQQIEAQIAALPERILSRMPEETAHKLIESLSADPLLMGMTRQAADSPQALAPAVELADEDPDNASIERLTKSCLTVQASSLPADQLNVTFQLYTRQNPRQPFVLGPQISRDELLSRTPFRAGRPLKWVTHGFHTNVDKSEWMLDTKDKILRHEDANVILTDWRRGASPALAFYPKAAANAHVVAKMIVKILRRLLTDIDLSQVHLIGHSLGAHIMGFVGSAFTEEYLHQEQLQLNSNGRWKRTQSDEQVSVVPPRPMPSPLIGRITACDPALPCFGSSSSGPNRGRKPNKRPTHGSQTAEHGDQSSQQVVRSPDDWTPALWTHLRPDSAILVEVIHSNPGVMGYAEPLGDYDFFPNGSDKQPGCMNGDETGDSGSSDQPNETPQSADSTQRRSTRVRRSMSRPTTAGLWLNSSASNEAATSSKRELSRPPASLARAGFGVDRISKTFNSFIRPIRNFLHAYTCSHHRSVEYMVESLYYELVPPEQRLDRQQVCQLVGYRCQDYHSFKRGFCFTCRNDLECRSLAFQSSSTISLAKAIETSLSEEPGYTPSLASRFASIVRLEHNLINSNHRRKRSFRSSTTTAATDAIDSSQRPAQAMDMLDREKRILPTLNQYRQDYKPAQRNLYYFDTKSSGHGGFCLNHYHLFVKYRWFRVRESLAIERFRLVGSLNDFISFDPSSGKPWAPFKLNKFSQHTYTMLLTSVDFLGKIEALIIHGDQLRASLIEHIDVSYMSNTDAQVRSQYSARLCRADSLGQTASDKSPELASWLGLSQLEPQDRPAQSINLFVRCPSASSLV